MDQSKIGSFLRELRKEKSLTQEQLAEQFGVSGRTVSRWENGNNMPDISMLVEMAEFYDIDIREIIDGERKSEIMKTEIKETLEKVAEYSDAEKEKILKSLHLYTVLSAIAFFVLIIMIPLRKLSSFADTHLSSLSMSIAVFGFALMATSVLNVLQIKGSMSKNRFKKVRSKMIITFMSIMVVIAIAIAVLAGLISK